jgi:tetratricopeptide (TPR) repeat protein
VPIQNDVGELAYFARRHDLASREARRALDMDSRFGRSFRLLGDLALDRGDLVEAIAAFTRAVDLTDRGAEALGALARGYARAADEANLHAILAELASKPYVSPYTLATIHAARGDCDQALTLLDHAYEQSAPALPFMGIDPRLDPLRGDARFGELLRRTGLPG